VREAAPSEHQLESRAARAPIGADASEVVVDVGEAGDVMMPDSASTNDCRLDVETDDDDDDDDGVAGAIDVVVVLEGSATPSPQQPTQVAVGDPKTAEAAVSPPASRSSAPAAATEAAASGPSALSSAPAAAAAVSRPSERFEGLNGARLLASVHIVLGHLYQMNAVGGGVYLFACAPLSKSQAHLAEQSGLAWPIGRGWPKPGAWLPWA